MNAPLCSRLPHGTGGVRACLDGDMQQRRALADDYGGDEKLTKKPANSNSRRKTHLR